MSTTQATAGGLNKVENASSTITLKDLKASSPILAIHQSLMANNNNSNSNHSGSDVDVNDENAPSNFPVENVTNNSDKVIYESPYERPLTSIHISPPATHHNSNLAHVIPPTAASIATNVAKIEGEMETDYTLHALQHTYPTVHKSIHHTITTTASTTTHYRDIMVDENLENKQQNSVNEEDDVWRPW